AASTRANDDTLRPLPAAYTRAPSWVTPTPERQTRTLLPRVPPQRRLALVSRPATGAALSTMSDRFWRTEASVGAMLTSRPHTPTVGRPAESITRLAAPSTRGRTILPSA